jgi:hypothetical protein
MIARMVVVILAALLALPVGSSEPRSVAAKQKLKTVTQTFINNGQIGDPGPGPFFPYPVILEVGGLKRGKIKDVNLILHGYSHTFPGAIGAMLVSPDGRNAVVMNRRWRCRRHRECHADSG